jgi:putative membrane protein
MMIPGFGCFGNYGGYDWIGILISLAFIVIMVVAIIWLARRRFPSHQGQLTASLTNPREILQVRYARGEITREQYLEILDDLKV